MGVSMFKIRTCGWIIFAVMLFLPAVSVAGVATETLEKHVNELVRVLGDKTLEGEQGKMIKENTIRKISDDMFDFIELGKRTLGRNWIEFNADQRKEFVDLYRQLLESVYMGRLLEYNDEKIVFEKELMLTQDKAEVFSNIVTADKSIPINYRLTLKDGHWKVYDISIEGVSMIKNYRTQFTEILSKKSPEAMLEDLRQKVNETKS
jgi:phospholipid transport system substrate-binding protein